MNARSLAPLACALALACADPRAAQPAAPDASPSRAPSPSPTPTPTPSPSPSLTPPPGSPPPAVVERLAVPRDLPAFIVRASPSKPPRVVFVPGVCSNAYAYMVGFPEAARHAGGVVAIDGDLPCVGAPGFRSFSWDIAKVRARIDAALAAAGHVDTEDALTVVGYSQGAALLEQLVERAPSRYARLVLIAAPNDPIARRYAKSRGVVTMACSRDVTSRMKLAAKSIAALGVPSTYIEMPGCVHGELADGDTKFGEAFAWLDAHDPRATSP